MAVAKIKKLLVAAHRSEREQLLDELQRLGVVEIAEVHPEDLDEGQEMVQQDIPGEQLPGLEDEIAEVRYTLDFLDRYFPVKRTLIEQFAGSKVPMEMSQMEKAVELLEHKAIYKECRRLDESLNDSQNKKGRLVTNMEQVEPWIELDLPLDSPKETNWVRVHIGSVSAKNAQNLEAQLQAASPEAVLQQVSGDRDRMRIVVFMPKDALEAVHNVLVKHDFAPMVFPQFKGTVTEYLQDARNQFAKLEAEEAGLIEEVKALLESRISLYALYDILSLKRERFVTSGKLLRTETAVLLQGWIKEGDVEQLVQRIEGKLQSASVDIQEPGPDDSVPVALENNSITRPFEVILELYSLPRRFEIDPTIFIAGFFALFFAMAITDAGYGIMLAGLCYILLKKVRMSPLGKKTFQLLFAGGIGAIVLGILSGGWWGDLIVLSPLWFSPLEGDNAIKFLIIAFVLGIVHLYVGLGIGFYGNAKKEGFMAGVYDQGMWMVLVAGLLMWIAGGSSPQLAQAGKMASIAGALGLLLFQGRAQKNIFMRLGAGLYSLYNVTGYMSDILSYSRLLGLGMATGIIASVINTVAFMVADMIPVVGPIFTVLILVGGHGFNLFITVIGAYVHVSRLQYVEFFGKFYEGGGRAFAPFAPQTKYVHLESTGKQV